MILPSVLQTFSESGQDIIAIIKRSFSITIDVAFVTYSALSAMTDDFDDWVREKGGPAPGALRRDNELSDIIQDLRTVCLRGLPEFIDDIRVSLDVLYLHVCTEMQERRGDRVQCPSATVAMDL